MALTTDILNRAELFIEGVCDIAFDRLEDAKEVGRDLYRAGEEMHIEVIDVEHANQRIGWRYEADSDEWFKCQP